MNRNGIAICLTMTAILSFLTAGGVSLSRIRPEGENANAALILTERLRERGAAVDAAGLPVRFAVDAAMAPEGYRLEVTPQEIRIVSADAGGALYGAYALLDASASLEVPEMTLESAPANAWRGVFLNLRAIDASDPETLPNLKKLFYALSRQGINKLVIEFADMIRYPNVPFPATADRALTPEQVHELIAEAEGLNQEIIPYFQGLSHATWILSDPANRRFLEDPERNDWFMTWCPRDPEMRAWFKQVLDDTVDLFHPRYIHLALDEVPYCSWLLCERCKGSVSEELYRDTLIDYHGMLAERGVRMIVWHDLFLPLPNPYDPDSLVPGVRILDDLPKDILMNVWTYEADQASIQKSVDHFTGRGFEVLGAGFNRPDLVQGMARVYAAEPRGLGFINTYWFYAGDWSRFATTAVLTAMTRYTGLYGWNPEAPAWNEYAGNPVGDVTRHFFAPEELPAHLEASPLALPGNWRWDARGGGWIDGLPAELTAYGPDRCRWRPDFRQPLLRAAEKGVEIGVDREVMALEFIHAAAAPPDKAELSHMEHQIETPRLGRYRVRYADGSETEIPLEYRRNISDWNAALPGLAAETFYQGLNADGVCLTFSSWRWRNPRPEIPVESVTLEAEAGAVIFCAGLFAWVETAGPLLDDGMHYVSGEDFRRAWTLNTSAVTAEIETAAEGVRVVSSGAGADPGRVILDKLNLFPAGTSDGVNVEVSADSDALRLDIAIYLADENWENYSSFYWPILEGRNEVVAGWRNFRKEQGDLKPEDIRHLRVAFNVPRNTPAFELLLRGVRCSGADTPPVPRRGGWQTLY